MKELGLGSNSIEEVRTYWNNRPCNIRHSSKSIGTREYFDEVESRKYLVEPHIPDFADFSKYEGKKVLEIGCGIGTDAVNFARAGAKYTGVDLSEQSMELARKRFEVFGLNGLFLCVDAENLSSHLNGEKFDLIYSFGVIHHSPDPRKIISEAHSLLDDGGELKLMVYEKNSWKSAMIDAGFDQPEAQFGCPIAYSFDDGDVMELLEGYFMVTEMSNDHIFPYEVEAYKNYQYKLQPWFLEMPPKMRRALELRFGWHKLISASKI